MAHAYIKRFQIREFNHWPYNAVESVMLVDRREPVIVPAGMQGDIHYRCYLRHPDQYLFVASMQPYDPSWEKSEALEVSVYQLKVEQPLAMQIEYVLFESYLASDHAKLRPLLEEIKSGALTPESFPVSLRPDSVMTTAKGAINPWQDRRLDGKQPPDHAVSVFYVTEKSELPYINNHTIPEHLDFDFVQAAVVTYDFYEVPPTYQILMNRLGKYVNWLEDRLRSKPRGKNRKRPVTGSR
jgi:hypothetical protein